MDQFKVNCRYDKLVEPKKIIPNPDNPHKHSPRQIQAFIKILDENGWRHPLIVSNQSGKLIVGHGRLLAAKMSEQEKIPVEYQDFKNEDEEYQFMVADNGISKWGELDYQMINLKLPEIGPIDIELLAIPDFTATPEEKDEDIPSNKNKKYLLEIEFPNEDERATVYDSLISQGLIVRVKD